MAAGTTAVGFHPAERGLAAPELMAMELMAPELMATVVMRRGGSATASADVVVRSRVVVAAGPY